MKKTKIGLIGFGIAVCLVAGVVTITYYDKTALHKTKLSIEEYTKEVTLDRQISKVYLENSFYNIECVFTLANTPFNSLNIEVFAKEKNNENALELPFVYAQVDNENNFITGSRINPNGGFIAKIKQSAIDKAKDYSIYVLYTQNNIKYLIPLNYEINKGKIIENKNSVVQAFMEEK